MSNAIVKTVNITGADGSRLLKLDVSISGKNGSVTVAEIESATGLEHFSIDDAVVIQGIRCVIDKCGKIGTSSGIGVTRTARVGHRALKTFKYLTLSPDLVYYKPYTLQDIINSINVAGLNVTLCGYNLKVASYSFEGYVEDLLDNIASLAYGEVVYLASVDKYVIVTPDRDVTTVGTNTLTLGEDDFISYDIQDRKDPNARSFAHELVRAIKDLAKLNAQLIDVKAVLAVPEKTKNLVGSLDFDFGAKTGPKEIAPGLVVETIDIDEWEFDLTNSDPPDKTTLYFQTRTVREQASTDTGNVIKGKKQGVWSIERAQIYKKLPFEPSTGRVFFKGHTTNLQCLGMLSYTEYTAMVNATQGSKPLDNLIYTTGWQELTDIVIKETQTKDKNGVILTTYEPYVRFTVHPLVMRSVTESCIAAGDNSIRARAKALAKLQYACEGQVTVEVSSTAIQYNGSLDKHGRLISSSGQVQLVFVPDSIRPGLGSSSTYSFNINAAGAFYAPVAGMDCDFIVSNLIYRTPTGVTSNMDGLIDTNRIKIELDKAWVDLMALAKTQPPLAYFATTTKSGFPKLLMDAPQPSLLLGKPTDIIRTNTGNTVGMVNEKSSLFNADREVTIPLSMSRYTSPNKTKAELQLSIIELEDRIALLKRILLRSNAGKSTDLRNMTKNLITYHTLLEKVKNEALYTMQRLKKDLDTEVQAFIESFNTAEYNLVVEAQVSTILPDVITNVGDTLRLPSDVSGLSFKVISVTVSNNIMNVTARHKP